MAGATFTAAAIDFPPPPVVSTGRCVFVGRTVGVGLSFESPTTLCVAAAGGAVGVGLTPAARDFAVATTFTGAFSTVFLAAVFTVIVFAGAVFVAVDFFAGAVFVAVDFFAGAAFVAVDFFAASFVGALLTAFAGGWLEDLAGAAAFVADFPCTG